VLQSQWQWQWQFIRPLPSTAALASRRSSLPLRRTRPKRNSLATPGNPAQYDGERRKRGNGTTHLKQLMRTHHAAAGGTAEGEQVLSTGSERSDRSVWVGMWTD
jgi:hypothetical protein